MAKVLGEQWHIESGIRGRILVKDASGETVAEVLAKNQALAVLMATAPEMRDLLEAASHCLRSYQFGNSAPSLAKEMADACDQVVRKSRGEV